MNPKPSEDSDLKDIAMFFLMVAALPIYTIGFLAGTVFVPLRGGWREAMVIVGGEPETPEK